VTGCHHYNITYSCLLSNSTANLISTMKFCKLPLTLNSGFLSVNSPELIIVVLVGLVGLVGQVGLVGLELPLTVTIRVSRVSAMVSARYCQV